MKIDQIQKITQAEILCGHEMQEEIKSACGADLMSDVLAFSKENGMLITGLVNPQVIRTAEMMDFKAILFVRGKQPSKEMVEMAAEKSISLLTTQLTMYFACGHLYAEGLGADA